MNRKDLERIKYRAEKAHKRSPFLRLGQIFYNKLYFEYPEEAEKICGTEFDPFHVDANIDKCIEKLLEEK